MDRRKRAELALRSLTRREREILKLLGAGLTNPEIAERLAISARTTKFHVQNVVEKLGVADQSRAAERVREFVLLPESVGLTAVGTGGRKPTAIAPDPLGERRREGRARSKGG